MQSNKYERHIKGYNFCGPGTRYAERMNGTYESFIDKPIGRKPYDQPVNKLDACCKSHDEVYSDPGASRKAIRDSDNRLMKCSETAGQPVHGAILRTIFRGKKLAEDVGVLDPQSFVREPPTKPSVRAFIPHLKTGQAVVALSTRHFTEIPRG